MKTILHQNKFATLYLDEQIPAISEEWHGSASIEEFQSILQTKLEMFTELKKQHESLSWIANVVGLKVDNEAKNWANQLFHRQLHPAGVAKIAFIVPVGVYDELSDEYHKEKMDAQKEIRLCYFDGYEKASEWLKSASEKK
ncbi:MAG: hypothetical protein ACI85I_000174 [Arenicella sp.]|jgi:hypothetical protein